MSNPSQGAGRSTTLHIDDVFQRSLLQRRVLLARGSGFKVGFSEVDATVCVQLLAEHGRMPAHAGRTLRERQRKTEVEQRLEGLDREASLLRLHLKRVISQT